MDPAATLDQIRAYCRALLDDESPDYNPDNLGQDAIGLAEAVQNLDRWLSQGGFTPQQWATLRGQRATEAEQQYWRNR